MWLTNKEEGKLGEYKELKNITLLKQGEIFYFKDKIGERLELEKIPRIQFFINQFSALLLLSFSFALINVLLYPTLLSLFIPMIELVFYRLLDTCKLDKKAIRYFYYLFAIMIIFEILFLFASLYFSQSLSMALNSFNLNEFYITLNFYLFARLMLLSNQIKFGKDIFRFKNHRGFYVWSTLCS